MSASKDLLLELLDVGSLDIVNVGDMKAGLQRFVLAKPTNFICSVRSKSVTSKQIVVDLKARELLSNGGYGQRLAESNAAGEIKRQDGSSTDKQGGIGTSKQGRSGTNKQGGIGTSKQGGSGTNKQGGISTNKQGGSGASKRHEYWPF
jgi:hypothetical protein